MQNQLAKILKKARTQSYLGKYESAMSLYRQVHKLTDFLLKQGKFAFAQEVKQFIHVQSTLLNSLIQTLNKTQLHDQVCSPKLKKQRTVPSIKTPTKPQFKPQFNEKINKVNEKCITPRVQQRKQQWIPPPTKDPRKGKEANKKSKKDSKQKKSMTEISKKEERADHELVAALQRQVLQNKPNISFDDIAALKKTKQLIQQAILLPLCIPNYFTGIRKPWNGLLLYGPPGTGKTLLAKAIATVVQQQDGQNDLLQYNASSLASKWKGESQKMMRILFELARYHAPSTIFFDQIDSLSSKRQGASDSSNKVKTQMMVQMDGVEGHKQRVIVIAATNRPWDLDQAIRRRMQKRVYIPLPDQHARKEMFNINLRNINCSKEIDWDRLVKQTQGYSGSDIAQLCRETAFIPLRKKIAQMGGYGQIDKISDEKFDPQLSQQDFLEGIRNVNKSVSVRDLKGYQKFTSEFGSS